jgi:putative transposase
LSSGRLNPDNWKLGLNRMRFDPDKHHRHSIRLKHYDYSHAGAYFITICTQDKKCLFGEIIGGEIRLNEAGNMVQTIWNELPKNYPGVDIDIFVVMPNHFHGIIIVGAGPRACPKFGQPQGVAPTQLSLPDVVHRFKSLTTTRYRHAMGKFGQILLRGHLWQRNYYEHVIRDESDLARIRQYIMDNPVRWEDDEENPINQR